MSEYIDNQIKRRDTLKRLIRDLHEGRTVDDVKAEFAALLRDVGAAEIAEIEQALIDEGLPEGEVKRLCDVHVAVFRESLDAQPRPEAIPGHPVHTFRAENEAAVRVLDGLREALEALAGMAGPASFDRARGSLRQLQEYDRHYLRKENILFPYLEQHGFAGPSSVMWAIHDDVRAGWRALDQMLAAGPGDDPAAFGARVREVFQPLDTAIREMFYKEEHILFPTALEKLTEEEWRAIRAQEAELGYAYVEPGDQWPLRAAASEPTRPPVETREPGEDMLHLDTGTLTVQEVSRVLTHLPVEYHLRGQRRYGSLLLPDQGTGFPALPRDHRAQGAEMPPAGQCPSRAAHRGRLPGRAPRRGRVLDSDAGEVRPHPLLRRPG